MIVTITSCAPVRALRRPTRPPQIAPAAMPTRIARVTWTGHGMFELVADPAGGRTGHQHLTPATDVEQRGTEGQADTETGDDQGSGELEGLGQGPDRGLEVLRAGVVDRAAEECGVGAPDGVPGRREEVGRSRGHVAERVAHLFVGEHDEQGARPGPRAAPRRTPRPRFRRRSRAAPCFQRSSSGASGLSVGSGSVDTGVDPVELMPRLPRDARRSSSGRAPRAVCRVARCPRSGRGRAP